MIYGDTALVRHVNLFAAYYTSQGVSTHIVVLPRCLLCYWYSLLRERHQPNACSGALTENYHSLSAKLDFATDSGHFNFTTAITQFHD